MTRLLTVADVADRLGVTKDWVWAQARVGRIPHVQYRRFREDALEKWLDELELQSVEHGGAGGQPFVGPASAARSARRAQVAGRDAAAPRAY